MVNRRSESWRCLGVILFASVLLVAAAWLRGAEYDEQYTLFLTAGVPRPVWPESVIRAGDVRALQVGHGALSAIVTDLRHTDVHPPLYFWAADLWRGVVGSGLFATRILSVGCSLATLAVVWIVARLAGVPPVMAMLVTIGCYGFSYTAVLARGFALAQLLTLLGFACLLAAGKRSRFALAAGVLFGAASATNYLAAFAGIAATVAFSVRRLLAGYFGHGDPRGRWPKMPPARHEVASGIEVTGIGDMHPTHRPWPSSFLPREGADGSDSIRWRDGYQSVGGILLGFAPFLALDAWFFIAQREQRIGQFPRFHLLASLGRLARYSTANVFGGLPLYVSGHVARTALSLALGGLLLAAVGLVACRWRSIGIPRARGLLAAAAMAPPIGLLALGAIFDNTPIELRYLSFAVPFMALLVAGAMASLPRVIPALLLAVQAAALAGLILRQETMQPARATASAAAELVEDGVVLVPRGNDGVGIVGAFAIEAPAAMPMLVVAADETPSRLRHRIAGFPRVLVASLTQDDASRAALPMMLAAFTPPCWRQVAAGFNVIVYHRVCDGE